MVWLNRCIPVTLLDWSTELTQYLSSNNPSSAQLKVVCHDLLCGKSWVTPRPIDTVICDPPWYPLYYRLFLAQAAASTSIGATILLSLLPVNTRPEAIVDRWDIFETGRSIMDPEN